MTVSTDFRPERAWWWEKNQPIGPQLVRFFRWWRDNSPSVYPATDELDDAALEAAVAGFVESKER